MVKFDPVIEAKSGFGLPDFREGCACIKEPWLFEASIFLREEILKRGFPTVRIMPASCMVEIRDDIMVNHDGAIYKCPGFIGRKDLRTASTYVAGHFSDRLGRRPFLFITAYTDAAVLFFYTVIENTFQLYLLQALLGISGPLDGTFVLYP